MIRRPVTGEDLERLRAEREEADRRYNDALTALDRSLPHPPAAPGPPPPFDRSQLEALNGTWEILAGHHLPPPRGLRSRLAGFVWRLVAPAFEAQQAFNARLVDHLNRSAERQRALDDVLAATAAALHEHADRLARFHSHLIQYLQQVTGYIDTRDRQVEGDIVAVYDAAVNALTDHVRRALESLAAREVRANGRVDAVAAAQDDLRSTVAVLQQSSATFRRELERLIADRAPARDTADGAPPPAAVIDSYKYVGFEDRFRGPQEEIRARLTSYVPIFAGATDVLDVGCGRGELLELLRDAGIRARGLDVNHEMVEVCRARGLDVAEGDLLSYLQRLPDGSLGGLIAIQVVEHLQPDYLMRSLDLAYDKLRPGAPIVLETINPACWFAFFSSYVRDLTHVRPLHPDTLQYLLTASGFGRVRVEYRSPYPEFEKLQTAAAPPEGAGVEHALAADLVETFNANMQRLNTLLFTHLDYAAIGERL